ncbi:MAG: inositol monophosphatase [Propionibacteriaceae bacterium]|jgi:fructose-1,6-bisphosphatase/inositol monophosphatase family enzyme|nr:inositol monophosphatase [Propionibacteriaceae bacterium]
MQTEEVAEILFEVTERVIMPRFGHLERDEVQQKKPGDLVTIADKEAEAEIGEALSQRTPDALIVGEEGVFTDTRIMDALPGADHAWVLDPIDGTRNFTKASPDFAVMLAEVIHGETVRSWIYQPVHSKLYVAEHGGGVTCNGAQLRPVNPGREVPLGATYVPLKGESELSIKVRRTWGSAGVDYPNLLEGVVDFLAYRSMFPWDHLPAGLMINELGGKIASDEGVPYRAGVFGRRVISAMNDLVWKQVRDAIALR